MSLSPLKAAFAAFVVSGCFQPVKTDAGEPVYITDEEGPALPVQLGTCPTSRELIDGKIFHAAYIASTPGMTHAVAVTLRAKSLPDVAGCPNNSRRDAQCEQRDESLRERVQLNAQQLTCVLQDFERIEVQPVWYERPYLLTTGVPAPIGLAFSARLTSQQIETLAAHPFVRRIDPLPGEVAALGVAAPAPSVECPSESDAEIAQPKVTEAATIEGKGRQPVVINLKDEGLLPAAIECTDAACENAWPRWWGRTVLNTRHTTCVRREMDRVVQASSPRVAYTGGSGLTAFALPPFGQLPYTLKSFGAGLTWEEANQLAAHPYIEKIWTFPGLAFEQNELGCPPDFSKPISSITCPSELSSSDDKFTAADSAVWKASAGPHEVLILVAGGAKVCPLPQCSTKPCPEHDQYINRMTAENTEAQRCVRGLIASVGGAASPEIFWLTNFFTATLSWAQIQEVAKHPHVRNIEGNGGEPPPRAP